MIQSRPRRPSRTLRLPARRPTSPSRPPRRARPTGRRPTNQSRPSRPSRTPRLPASPSPRRPRRRPQARGRRPPSKPRAPGRPRTSRASTRVPGQWPAGVRVPSMTPSRSPPMASVPASRSMRSRWTLAPSGPRWTARRPGNRGVRRSDRRWPGPARTGIDEPTETQLTAPLAGLPLSVGMDLPAGAAAWGVPPLPEDAPQVAPRSSFAESLAVQPDDGQRRPAARAVPRGDAVAPMGTVLGGASGSPPLPPSPPGPRRFPTRSTSGPANGPAPAARTPMRPACSPVPVVPGRAGRSPHRAAVRRSGPGRPGEPAGGRGTLRSARRPRRRQPLPRPRRSTGARTPASRPEPQPRRPRAGVRPPRPAPRPAVRPDRPDRRPVDQPHRPHTRPTVRPGRRPAVRPRRAGRPDQRATVRSRRAGQDGLPTSRSAARWGRPARSRTVAAGRRDGVRSRRSAGAGPISRGVPRRRGDRSVIRSSVRRRRVPARSNPCLFGQRAADRSRGRSPARPTGRPAPARRSDRSARRCPAGRSAHPPRPPRGPAHGLRRARDQRAGPGRSLDQPVGRRAESRVKHRRQRPGRVRGRPGRVRGLGRGAPHRKVQPH